jgi:hypothetical protein
VDVSASRSGVAFRMPRTGDEEVDGDGEGDGDEDVPDGEAEGVGIPPLGPPLIGAAGLMMPPSAMTEGVG